MTNEKSTEGTVERKEQSSPFDIGKGGILLLVAMITLAIALFAIFGGGGADVSSSGGESTDASAGDGGSGLNHASGGGDTGTDVVPVNTETATGTGTEAVIKKVVEIPWEKSVSDKGMFGIIHLVKEPNVLYMVASDFDEHDRGVIVFREEDWKNKRLEFEFGGATVTKQAFGTRSLKFNSKHGSGSSEIHYLYNLPIGPEGLVSPSDGKYVLVFLFKQ